MKVTTGTVTRGTVKVSRGILDEGERVLVLSLHSEEPVSLTAEEETELQAAADEIRKGEYVSGEDLLAELRQLTGR
jgi:hypothetical protein